MRENVHTRIAKNTLFLYIRMAVSMIVTLYTSRIVLNALGVSDYGIYNVVTGFVISFGFLNSAMHASVLRFLTVEFKNDNYVRINNIFSIGVLIHLILAIIIVIALELFGIYFMEYKLNVPHDRIVASKWVFQFSVISLFFSVINVPYRALILAHEDMDVYALISLLEVFAKLVISFAIVHTNFDKLIFYGFWLMIVAVIVQLFYIILCRLRYNEGRFRYYWDKQLFREMSGFAGWNLIGVFAGIAYNQGVNILLNILGGPIVNAARSIAFQVNGAVNQLVTNFQLAVNPPIMKAYANNDTSLSRLIISSCKLSYVLLLFIVIPFLFEAPFILRLWLKNVPEYTISFTRLALIDIIICSLAGPWHTLVQATGRVKKYQLVVSGILLLNLPLSYIFLKLGFAFEVTFIISILLSFIALLVRLILVKGVVHIEFINLFKTFLIPIVFVTIIICTSCIVVHCFMMHGLCRLLVTICLSWMSILILSWFLILDSSEKGIILKMLKIHESSYHS